MKKILLIISLAFITFNSFAQKGPRERIKAFKIAYITEELNLTSKEAQKFWPIYNGHQEVIKKLKGQERKLIKVLRDANDGTDGLNDQQVGKLLNNYIKTEEQKSEARKKLIIDLQQVIPNKKVLKLIKTEADFNKRILDKIRERRKKH